MDFSTIGLDQYDRKARLQPAILIVAPAILFALVWIPQVRTLGGVAILGVISLAAVTLLLSWVRFRGRRVERRMVGRDDFPSTRILRHRDTTLDPATKERIHVCLRAKALNVPTARQEKAGADKADAAYRSCVAWLLEQTRDDRLLQLENMEYGFRRNMRGIRWPAFTIAALALLLDLVTLAGRPGLTAEQMALGLLLAALLMAGCALWLLVVNDQFVEDASLTYARRLIAAAETL